MRLVLFICTGNICRSPMAEAWFRYRAGQRGLTEWEAASAGILASDGYPASEYAVKLLSQYGIDLSAFRSKELTLPQLQQANLIVVMEEEHKIQLSRMLPEVTHKIHLLGEYIGNSIDIPDPIGGDWTVFEQTFQLIRTGVDRLVEKLKDRFSENVPILEQEIYDFLSGPFRIVMGSDHGGFALKNALVSYLKGKGIETEDCGPYTLDPNDDYPDFATQVAVRVGLHRDCAGILFCRSGIGMSINANRVPHVRAALCRTPQEAILSRQHNCSNILVVGGNDLTEAKLFAIVDAWLNTPFSHEPRHIRRLQKLEKVNEVLIHQVLAQIAPEFYQLYQENTLWRLDFSQSFPFPHQGISLSVLSHWLGEYACFSPCEVDSLQALVENRLREKWKVNQEQKWFYSFSPWNWFPSKVKVSPSAGTLLVVGWGNSQSWCRRGEKKYGLLGKRIKLYSLPCQSDGIEIDYERLEADLFTIQPWGIWWLADTIPFIPDYSRLKKIKENQKIIWIIDGGNLSFYWLSRRIPSPPEWIDGVYFDFSLSPPGFSIPNVFSISGDLIPSIQVKSGSSLQNHPNVIQGLIHLLLFLTMLSRDIFALYFTRIMYYREKIGSNLKKRGISTFSEKSIGDWIPIWVSWKQAVLYENQMPLIVGEYEPWKEDTYLLRLYISHLMYFDLSDEELEKIAEGVSILLLGEADKSPEKIENLRLTVKQLFDQRSNRLVTDDFSSKCEGTC